jgi:hypothetical protein
MIQADAYCRPAHVHLMQTVGRRALVARCKMAYFHTLKIFILIQHMHYSLFRHAYKVGMISCSKIFRIMGAYFTSENNTHKKTSLL